MVIDVKRTERTISQLVLYSDDRNKKNSRKISMKGNGTLLGIMKNDILFDNVSVTLLRQVPIKRSLCVTVAIH